MRIYLAARYDRRFEMLGIASDLVRAGHVVTSAWIEGGRGDGSEVVAATEDMEDLSSADCLVAFTEEPTRGVPWAARGGRHVEFGVALAAGKRLCIVGPRENVFHHLPQVQVFDASADLVVALQTPPQARP
ncbi:MAG TPA: hypothetical protein VH374_12640 [Polyangia bacterium]|jgi:hypothetical protein|nr:hypothetical protein [Polyangia bacterium]